MHPCRPGVLKSREYSNGLSNGFRGRFPPSHVILTCSTYRNNVTRSHGKRVPVGAPVPYFLSLPPSGNVPAALLPRLAHFLSVPRLFPHDAEGVTFVPLLTVLGRVRYCEMYGSSSKMAAFAAAVAFMLSSLAGHVDALASTDTITWGGDNTRCSYQT